MANDQDAPSPAAWKITAHMIPIDVIAVHIPGQIEGVPEQWFRIPSWRVEFPDSAVLTGLDMRMHRSLGADDSWVIAEASTGFAALRGLGGEDYPELLERFCTSRLRTLTRAEIEARIEIARADLALRTANPLPQAQPHG